jgi:hypothetical protein
MFGADDQGPIVPESRDVDKFGKILQSREAVDYLRKAELPDFGHAHRIAGGDEAEVADLIERAAFNVEQALSTAHHHVESKDVRKVVQRLALDVKRLLMIFVTGPSEKTRQDGGCPAYNSSRDDGHLPRAGRA